VHYDFQGAGEFVLLRNSPDVEIQTRQTPIAASYLPGPDPYDGLAVCVGMNTAVAARLGTHRVTYEPNLSGVPDPTGLQLRVDGVLTTLGRTGLDLGNGGRITRTAAPGGIEIGFPDKTVLFVTPGWWDSQSAWYLNYDVVPSREGGGLAGAIGAQSWLPALPDGTTVGTMPRDPHDRYVALYQTFAEAWRITPTTSLFDYAPGTSTDTFTMRNWPPEHPPCTLPGKVPVNPASELVAIEACKGVLGESARNDCVYDVIVTGDPGFAATYTRSQSLQPSSVAPMPKKIAAFADFGVGMPRGTFGNSFDRGWSFNAGLEYLITSRVSAETILGHHRFPDVISGHADIRQLSANAKVYLIPPPYKFLPFVHGGGGAYKFSSGSSEFGTNLGAGVLYELNARFAVQGRYDFHNIDTGGTTTRFSTLQVGVWFLF